MNQTMRWQSSTPKPYETFVADMLRHVAAKYNAPECADLKTKVVLCETHDDWGELWSLAKQALNPDRLSTEYKEPPQIQTSSGWVKQNALTLQVVMKNLTTGRVISADEKVKRQTMIDYGIDADQASALSSFDAVMFVNNTNVKQALRAGLAFPLHLVLAHECINIIEQRTGQRIIQGFDAKTMFSDRQSVEAVLELMRRIGHNEFRHRYLTDEDVEAHARMARFLKEHHLLGTSR